MPEKPWPRALKRRAAILRIGAAWDDLQDAPSTATRAEMCLFRARRAGAPMELTARQVFAIIEAKPANASEELTPRARHSYRGRTFTAAAPPARRAWRSGRQSGLQPAGRLWGCLWGCWNRRTQFPIGKFGSRRLHHIAVPLPPPRRYAVAAVHQATAAIAASACSSQNTIAISRYIAAARVWCSSATCGLSVRW